MLKLQNLTKRFRGMDRAALDQLTLEIEEGEIVALAGASGSGKTTALRLIAGFERPDAGEVSLDGTLLADAKRVIPPERRNISVVFQDFALFPHLTVAENVAFGLADRDAAARERRVRELLKIAGIPELEGRYPHEISGGQQQRVALVRALAPNPRFVLLDEPFSNLDHTCTHRLLAETRQIIKESGSAAIVVTHDRYEAFTLADRIAVLSEGVLEQVGTAERIYAAPATREVAEFSGSASFIPVWTAAETMGNEWLSPLGPVPDDVAVVAAGGRPAAGNGENVGADSGDRYFAVVRPHHVRLQTNGSTPESDSSAGAVVKDVRFLGSVVAVRMHVEWPASHPAADGWEAAADELLAHVDGFPADIRAGERVGVTWG